MKMLERVGSRKASLWAKLNGLDPYYEQVVQPDEESFFDMSKSSITIGWEEVYIENGKVVDIPPGEANPVTM